MDILSAHKMRQREGSTWVWTELTPTAECRREGLKDEKTECERRCCCETLEQALATIDILLSKLVGGVGQEFPFYYMTMYRQQYSSYECCTINNYSSSSHVIVRCLLCYFSVFSVLWWRWCLGGG